MKPSRLFVARCQKFFWGCLMAAGGVLLAQEPAAAPATNAAPAEHGWSLGTPDGTTIEFAHGSRHELTFTVGKSVVSKDFAGHQDGSVGHDGIAREHPYMVAFDLPAPPQGYYELIVDLIYRNGAPPNIKIKVNDRRGLFPIRPVPKKSCDGEEASAMLLSRQRLVVPIEASWLKEKGNLIKLTPLGVGSLHYDAVQFRKVTGAFTGASQQLRVEPTLFYRKAKSGLAAVCRVMAPFQTKFAKGLATVQCGRETFAVSFTNTLYDFGVWEETLELPAFEKTARVTVRTDLDGRKDEATHDIQAARQWKVYICPKVHNDVGYTDLQPHVNELDNRNTDTVLDILEKYPFYKFNFETSWLVENYLDCRTEGSRKRFLDMAARQRATLNAFYLNLMTGICTGEELYRAMYYSHRLHREHGASFDSACLTDAPSHSWFLPTLLRDAGVKAFSNGSNQTRAPILHYSDLNDDSPYYWEGMNGERVLMWYARSYSQLKRLTGPDYGMEVSNFEWLKNSVPQFLVRYLREDYVPDAVMIYGAYVDNAAIPETGEAQLISKWNETYEYPKLIVGSDADYFGYIEKQFAERLPVHRGDCGAYWEDGVASSAQATTLNRQSQQILPRAETAAAFASLFDARNRYPAEDFYSAWKNVMFYNEHTWGAHNSISQPDREFVTRQWEVKESYAVRANLDSRNLLARGLNRLCQNIGVPGSSILAFNFQNRPRTEPLEVEIDQNVQLVDLSSKKPVAMDILSEKDGYRRIRFLAEDIPAMGYRAYSLDWLHAPPALANQKAPGETIESPFYTLVVDPQTGAIRSLLDKVDNRQLLDDKAAYKLNQYLYVSGGESSLILNHTFGTPPASLTVDSSSLVEIAENIKTPFGQRLVVIAKAKNTPRLRMEYIVYDKLRRVDIINTVEKDETRAKEAVYFAFPFAAEKPAFECQIQNGWVRPNEDQMPGACREWFTPQNLVHLQDGGYSVAWATPDAPLVTLTDINRGKWPVRLEIVNGHVYAYVMNNYWFTNYRAKQGGAFTFRFSITSGKTFTREQLADFDADTRTPVFAYPFVSSFSARIAQEGRPLPAGGASLFTHDTPNLQFVTFKAAEDGDGYILRLLEVGGKSGTAEIKFPTLQVREAHLCNGVEDNLEKLFTTPLCLRVPYKPHSYLTVRLKADSALRVAAKPLPENPAKAQQPKKPAKKKKQG